MAYLYVKKINACIECPSFKHSRNDMYLCTEINKIFCLKDKYLKSVYESCPLKVVDDYEE